MVNQNKGRLVSFLLTLFVIVGSVLGFIQVFGISVTRDAHASTGWQLQELWHTPATPPNQNASSTYDAGDILYSSGRVYEEFLIGCSSDIDCAFANGFDASAGGLVWNKSIGAGQVLSPLVSNGKIYFPSFRYQLQAYDATNDQLPLLWSGLGATAAINNRALYSQLGSTLASYFDAYDADTGQLKWEQTSPHCEGEPKVEVYNNLVYFIGCEIPNAVSANEWYILARNTSDGSIVWKQDVATPGDGTSPAPSLNSTLISNGSIFLASSGNASMTSYSTTDGTQQWHKTLSDTQIPTGSIASIGQIIASGSTVYALVNIEQTGFPTVISKEDIYALDAATGNEIWHNSTNVNISIYNSRGWPYGTMADGVLYFNYRSAIYAWDADTGNQLMMDDSVATSSGNTAYSRPLVVGNVLYITREDTSGSPNPYTLYAYNIIRQQPSIKLSPTSGAPGSVVSVTGSGWTPADDIDIFFSPLTSSSIPLVKATVTSSGTFQTSFTVPSHATLDSPHSVLAEDETTQAKATAPYVVTCASIGTVSPACYSNIYAGYVATSKPVLTQGTISMTYSDVKGSWQVPILVCPQNRFSPETSYAAFWVGLGGIFAPLEQIGILAKCEYLMGTSSGATYTPVWEMIGNTGTPAAQTITQGCSDSSFTTCIQVNNVKVAAGDTIDAEVKYQSTAKNYLLTIRDKTQKWHTGGDGTPLPPQSVPGSDTTAARGSAECIVEDPPPTSTLTVKTGMADFGSVFFTNCVADGKSIGSIGPDTVTFVMVKDTDGTIKAQPSGLNNARKAFSVTWFNPGP